MIDRAGGQGAADLIHRFRTGYMVAGGILIAGGLLAILFPYFGTLATTIFVGWILILSGVVEILHALSVRGAPAIVLNMLAGLLSLGVGTLILNDPMSGVFSLTLFLGGFLAADGVIRILSATQMVGVPGQGWVIVNGVSSLALAGALLWFLPTASLYALGILLGIDLIVAGSTLFFLGRVAKVFEDLVGGKE